MFLLREAAGSLFALSWSPGLKETPQAPAHPEGSKKTKCSSNTEEEIFTLQVPAHGKHSPFAYPQEKENNHSITAYSNNSL